ncbi:ribonuclease H-like domain-containing protein [Paraphoma chrysanthemicola]|uniref:Ribonuclease H-like domain-containing protein n=1 Tax=Paraphoma chrysanthemicola TaxID=798071 RepID=A0A8K0W280_9PLEO|nr:ribonuclease H-like domain-containing protein [Paraphoma chrysanthemicola]
MAAVPSERGTAMEVWADRQHTFYYPDQGAAIPENPSTVGVSREWDGEAYEKDLKALVKFGNSHDKNEDQKKRQDEKYRKVQAAIHPQRTELPNLSQALGTNQKLLTNHFQLDIGSSAFYRYEILDLEQGGRTKKKVQALFRKAVATWDCLRDDQDKFATDGRTTIISWKTLHDHLGGMPIAEQGDSTTFGHSNWPNNDSCALQVLWSDEDLSHTERHINILISKSFDEEVIKLSRTKFYARNARSSLGTAKLLEIIRGYYYTVNPGMGNLFLNFNIATSAVFSPVLVSDFLADNSTFDDFRLRLKYLEKLHAYVEHPHVLARLNNPSARIKKLSGLSKDDIERLAFFKKRKDQSGNAIPDGNGGWQLESTPTKVIDYLGEGIFPSISVRHGRPAINVGSSEEPVWYAQELLRIVPYQLYTRPVPDHLTGFMFKQAARSPTQAQWLIHEEGLRHLGFQGPKNERMPLRNGVPLSLYPAMTQVDSVRMPLPNIRYKGMTQGIGRAIWNIQDEYRFYTANLIGLKYYVIQTLGTDGEWDDANVDDHIQTFDNLLKDQMRLRCQIAAKDVKCLTPNAASSTLKGTALEEKLREARKSNAQLVVLMLPWPDKRIYTDFKNLADRQFGLRTLCVANPGKLDKPVDAQKYMANIAQKINIKYGGINASVEGIDLKTTLVLGADVVHPPKTAFDESPSIASMVGSTDKEGGAYRGVMRLQSKDKRDREIIDEVQSMVSQLIENWLDATRKGTKESLPKHIIYYRDGVSTGQYKKVVETEVPAIIAAHAAVKAKTRNMTALRSLTAIVGGKRHHTRFYPINDDDKDKSNNNNCLPGTYVDRGIVSPYFRDFYLQSHVGIKGTARPTHYFIVKVTGQPIASLKSDNDLRTLTHRLCYTYCRSTCGVSYATPTYYADRLCDRGRMYLPNTWSSNDPAHDALLKSTARAMHAQFQIDRNNTYRSGREYDPSTDTKDTTEIDDEIAHREEVRKEIRKLTLDFAMKEFYKYKIDAGEDMKGNPWHTDLNKIMFWM